MATRDYLKGIRLVRRTGSFVEPFEFTSATVEKLSKWLDDQGIEELRCAVELAISMEQDRRGEAGVGEARDALDRVAELAHALAQLLEMAPGHAEPELLLIAHMHLGDVHGIDRLVSSLITLSVAATDRAKRLPTQGKRLAYPELISAIARTVEPRGMRISAAPGSAFVSLSRCVFEAAGVFQDPRGSIRWLQDQGA